jgi:UDP-2-acetamido-3-amino-2,3-dideoxy-glucuronate N-acetyltransferase
MENTNALTKIIEIPKFDTNGTLCIAEFPTHIPFQINRIFYIFNVAEGEVRGKHTHLQNEQVLFCIKGSIKIALDDGSVKEEVLLDSPNKGVLLETMVWHEMHDFTKDTILLVLASHQYDEGDYIRSYEEFLKHKNDTL